MKRHGYNWDGYTLGEVLYATMARKGITVPQLKEMSRVHQTDLEKILRDVEVDDYEEKVTRMVHALDIDHIVPVTPTLDELGEEIDACPLLGLMARWQLTRGTELATLVGVNHGTIYTAMLGDGPIPKRIYQLVERMGMDPDALARDHEKFRNHVQNRLRRRVRLIEEAQGPAAAGGVLDRIDNPPPAGKRERPDPLPAPLPRKRTRKREAVADVA